MPNADRKIQREMTETKINIADVPAKAKVAKKYKRAVAVDGNQWKRRNIEFCAKNQEMETKGPPTAESVMFSFAHAHAHGTSTLEQMQMRNALPIYQSRTIVDIPPDFRKFSSNIWEREISGNGSALNYLFWNNYRLGLALYYNFPGGGENQ